MTSASWAVTLGVPAVVLVVAIIIIFYSLGQKKAGKLFKSDSYDGIIQTAIASGKRPKKAA